MNSNDPSTPDEIPEGHQRLMVPPFRTRLVNILTDEVLQDPTKEHDSIRDAISKIRKRPSWTEGMGLREHIRPDIQAQVIDAIGTVVARLVVVEVQTIEIPVISILDLQLADPSLRGVTLRWVPITEEAALAIARRWKDATNPGISGQTGGH